eukprot:SAG31_NODE_27771_length_420_cov_0.965732_1_plen_114_part_01
MAGAGPKLLLLGGVEQAQLSSLSLFIVIFITLNYLREYIAAPASSSLEHGLRPLLNQHRQPQTPRRRSEYTIPLVRDVAGRQRDVMLGPAVRCSRSLGRRCVVIAVIAFKRCKL